MDLRWSDFLMLRHSSEESRQEAIQFLLPYLAPNLCAEKKKEVRSLVMRWQNYFKKKWSKYRGRGLEVFVEREKEWLSRKMCISAKFLRNKIAPTGESSRSRRRRVSQVSSEQREEHDILLLGTAKSIEKSGTPQSKARAKLLRSLAKKKSRAVEILNITPKKTTVQRNLTTDEALKLLLELNLTKAQYNTLRKVTNGVGHKDLFPSYLKVAAAKESCRPLQALRADEKGVSVGLSSLLQHTCHRIVQLQRDCIIQSVEPDDNATKHATVILSWGMDGAGSQAHYNQHAIGQDFVEESHLFIVSVVPLQLSSGDTVYWQNPKPQSPLYCRPLKMIFQKEDRDFVLQQRALVEAEIAQLQPFELQAAENTKIIVNCKLFLTLIDGKILSFFTDAKSQQACAICHSNPTDFTLQNIGTDKFKPIDSALRYGISPLHAWIRLFEFCLHLSYRAPFKIWRVDKSWKESVKQRKEAIQKAMFEKLALRVDFPNAVGGNSNNGNTARRAFDDVEALADILGMNARLLLNLKRILVCLSCQLPVKPDLFGELCHETCILFHSLYDWFRMPSTLHKILLHGRQIMEESPLPLGIMGEDGQESRHKLFRYFRLHHSRKKDRISTNLDMFNRSLDTTDPLLSSSRLTMRTQPKRKSLKIIADLLLEPEDSSIEDVDTEDSFFEYFDVDIPVAEEVEIS